jgi:imidazole glycerol phosphate synthase, glutamine amidotransferase subunit
MRSALIIDYHLGNLFSLRNACEQVGLHVTVSSNPQDVRDCHLLMLPGVGAFGEAIENLQQLGLFDAVIDHARQGKLLVGICLGMQLLFSRSEEFGDNAGLNLIQGVVRRFPSVCNNITLRIPHVGWNVLKQNGSETREPFFCHLRKDSCVYYVHSYYVEPVDSSIITATTEYERV